MRISPEIREAYPFNPVSKHYSHLKNTRHIEFSNPLLLSFTINSFRILKRIERRNREFFVRCVEEFCKLETDPNFPLPIDLSTAIQKLLELLGTELTGENESSREKWCDNIKEYVQLKLSKNFHKNPPFLEDSDEDISSLEDFKECLLSSLVHNCFESCTLNSSKGDIHHMICLSVKPNKIYCFDDHSYERRQSVYENETVSIMHNPVGPALVWDDLELCIVEGRTVPDFWFEDRLVHDEPIFNSNVDNIWYKSMYVKYGSNTTTRDFFFKEYEEFLRNQNIESISNKLCLLEMRDPEFLDHRNFQKISDLIEIWSSFSSSKRMVLSLILDDQVHGANKDMLKKAMNVAKTRIVHGR